MIHLNQLCKLNVAKSCCGVVDPPFFKSIVGCFEVNKIPLELPFLPVKLSSKIFRTRPTASLRYDANLALSRKNTGSNNEI